MTDNKGPHSGYVILSRRSNQGEAADHGTLHHKVHLAQRRRRALPLQDFEEISMVRVRAAGVALFNRSGNVFAHWTGPGAIGVFPGQAIMLARSTDNALGILVYVVDRALLNGIFVLRFHVTTADFNGVQLIRANTAIHEFLLASSPVKRPFPAPQHQRYGKGPVLVTHKEKCSLARLRVH